MLSPEGSLPAGYVPDTTDQTLLTFKPTSLRTGDGRLEVIGDLTLIRVERTVTTMPTEAYAGAVYGDPVIHNCNPRNHFSVPECERPRVYRGL